MWARHVEQEYDRTAWVTGMRLATPYVNNSSTVYLERLKTSTDAGVMMGLASIAG